jgi:hypothetical protein
MLDMMGRVVHQSLHPGTLNQTYLLDNISVPNGLYVIHTSGNKVDLSKTILIWK